MSRALKALNNQKIELEIQIASLKAQLNRVQSAITALTAGDLFDEMYPIAYRERREPGTLKQMAFTVLFEEQKAMTATQILGKIYEKFGERVERTSMSPQLSRLGQQGYLVREENLWKISENYRQSGADFYLLKSTGDLI
jgi:hypothetical protein